MAFTFYPYQRFTGVGEPWWFLKEKLVTATWTVVSSSDATTFGAGDNLDPGGPYTGTFDNTNAWVVLQAPDVAVPAGTVKRQICLQKPAFAGGIIGFYSSDGVGFSGGGATTRPTAADEQTITNNGGSHYLAKVSPFNTATDPLREITTYTIGGVSEGYSFLMETQRHGDGHIQAGMFLDHLTSPAANLDADPAIVGGFVDGSVHYQVGTALWTRTTVGNTTHNIGGWFRKGEVNEAFVSYPLGFWGYNDGFLGTLEYWHNDITESRGQPNPDNRYDVLPLVYARGIDVFSTELGFKGISTLFKLTKGAFSEGTLTLNADKTLRACYGVVTPWDGVTSVRV